MWKSWIRKALEPETLWVLSCGHLWNSPHVSLCEFQSQSRCTENTPVDELAVWRKHKQILHLDLGPVFKIYTNSQSLRKKHPEFSNTSDCKCFRWHFSLQLLSSWQLLGTVPLCLVADIALTLYLEATDLLVLGSRLGFFFDPLQPNFFSIKRVLGYLSGLQLQPLEELSAPERLEGAERVLTLPSTFLPWLLSVYCLFSLKRLFHVLRSVTWYLL